jgi:hypothetical protein
MGAGFVIDRYAWRKVAEQMVRPPIFAEDVFAQFVSERICQRTPAEIEDLVSFMEECRVSNPPLFEYLQQRVAASVLHPLAKSSSLDTLSKAEHHLPVLEPQPPQRTAETIADVLNRHSSEYALSTRPKRDYLQHVETHSIELTNGDSCDLTQLFRKYRQYSRSLILADPYLFHKRSALGIRAFIDSLVKKPTTTRILLLTSDFRSEKAPETDFTVFHGLNAEIRLVNQFIASKEMHDRWVIADWTAFHVGAGMDSFITGRVMKTTTIQVHPRLASTHKTYDEALAHHEWLAEDGQSKRFEF